MWWRAYLIALGLVGLDQFSKYVAVVELADGPTAVLPILTMRFACNTGAAFSMLEGFGPILALVGGAFVIYFSVQIYASRKDESTSRLFLTAMALILAGAAGNLLDRLFRGCVVDFVHVHYNAFSFPIFNVADSCISIGAACWLLVIFSEMRQYARPKTGKSSGSDV